MNQIAQLDHHALQLRQQAGRIAALQIQVTRQIAIGHANTDGILDICVASKVGLAVFLGQ